MILIKEISESERKRLGIKYDLNSPLELTIYWLERAKYLTTEKDEKEARKKATEGSKLLELGKLRENNSKIQKVLDTYGDALISVLTHYRFRIGKSYTKHLIQLFTPEVKYAYLMACHSLSEKYGRKEKWMVSKGLVALLAGTMAYSKNRPLTTEHITKATERVIKDEKFVDKVLGALNR